MAQNSKATRPKMGKGSAILAEDSYQNWSGATSSYKTIMKTFVIHGTIKGHITMIMLYNF